MTSNINKKRVVYDQGFDIFLDEDSIILDVAKYLATALNLGYKVEIIVRGANEDN